MAIGINWGEIWNEAIWDTDIWAQIIAETPEVSSIYAQDGSLNVCIDTGNSSDYGTSGIYAPSGGYRINTTDAGPGLYAADGAFRGVISDDEGTPAAGFGLYTPDGALRLTSSGSAYFNFPGIYARDGSTKVTVVN